MDNAVIFDMDGLLIDSEPFWKEAESHVFSSVGVVLCETMALRTATMTTKEVTEFWYGVSPWNGRSLKEIENSVIDRVESNVLINGSSMPGVEYILNYFCERNFKIGLSTNSPHRLIAAVLEKLNIRKYFQAVSSSEHEDKGKPSPDVYLKTAEKLSVYPGRCIAFEDSASGLRAATSANMKTIVVPHVNEYHNSEFVAAHIKLASLADFKECHLEQLGF